MSHTCVWVLSDVNELPVRRCGDPVRYTMTRDDDDRPVRKYKPFCDRHQTLADAEDAQDVWPVD